MPKHFLRAPGFEPGSDTWEASMLNHYTTRAKVASGLLLRLLLCKFEFGKLFQKCMFSSILCSKTIVYGSCLLLNAHCPQPRPRLHVGNRAMDTTPAAPNTCQAANASVPFLEPVNNAEGAVVVAPTSLQVWYGVPATAAGALDATMRDALPHLFAQDKLLLHKLVTMMSPTQLMSRGVPVCRAVQVPGSFVVTFPDAYHAGKLHTT